MSHLTIRVVDYRRSNYCKGCIFYYPKKLGNHCPKCSLLARTKPHHKTNERYR